MKTILVLTFAFATAFGTSIALAGGGCGPGWHRGPRGGCLRNIVQPDRQACPRGSHIVPGGRCRSNRR